MYVYLIGHKSELKIHTYIGVTEDFNKRLKEHNVGSSWFPIMVLECTEDIATKIQDIWRRATSAEDRVKQGFVFTKEHYLTAYVAELKIGLLKEMPPGEVKDLDQKFWDSL
jgi:predicted GIY-YIG superfamily endonuclease